MTEDFDGSSVAPSPVGESEVKPFEVEGLYEELRALCQRAGWAPPKVVELGKWLKENGGAKTLK